MTFMHSQRSLFENIEISIIFIWEKISTMINFFQIQNESIASNKLFVLRFFFQDI